MQLTNEAVSFKMTIPEMAELIMQVSHFIVQFFILAVEMVDSLLIVAH